MSRQVTGSLNSLNANVQIVTDDPSLPQVGSVGVQIGGAYTGIIAFQATYDNLNWFGVNGIPITSAGGSPVASTASGGQFAVSVFGFAAVRAIMTSYTAGNPTVTLDAGVGVVPSSGLVAVTLTPENAGGPPLSTGLPSLVAGESQKSYQASSSWQGILSSAIPGNSFITFLDNPWVQGLTVGARILISSSNNNPATEEVVVGTNNTPSATVGAITVQLVNPVVTGGNWATFDRFDPNGPVVGETMFGQSGRLNYLVNPLPVDAKRPIVPQIQATGNPGVAAVQITPDALGANDMTFMRQIFEQMLAEQRKTNIMLAQMKDSGPMDIQGLVDPNTAIQ